jgi:MFS transporter, DHA1 family, tetracycline resistance protein
MTAAVATPGRLALPFILLTLTINAMGFGLMLPVLPDLIREVTGGDLAYAAVWGGVLASSFAVMQFLFGPAVGNLSDRFGRRPVLLAALALLAVDYLIMALAGTIWLLLFGRIVAGITAATQVVAGAFIADISAPERKAAGFGLMGAAFGAGFILGPAFGGLLAEFGTRAPFWAAAVLVLANLALGWWAMPESLAPGARRPWHWRRANPLGALRQMGRLPGVHRLLVVFFLYEFAFIVYPATWAYFAIARFGWSPGMIGASLAAFGICFALVQGGLIRVILRLLGERGTILYGLVVNLAGFAFLAQVENGTLALIVTPLTALGAVVVPALMGIISRGADADQQGEVQGAIASARSMAFIFGPLLMSQIFFGFTAPGAPVHLPGAAFILSAVLMVACVLVFVARPRAGAPA